YEGGKLYILQTRPVTTLKRAASTAKLDRVDAPVLVTGACASPGVGSGNVIVVHNLDELELVQKGDILVTEMTTPDFVPAMKRVSAIVTDKGGRTCHAAIISRELGVPCIVGTENATRALTTGMEITVDAGAGKVYEGIVNIRVTAEATESRFKKTQTKVYVNLADPDLAERVAAMNVDGVGLLRAEFIAALSGKHPNYLLDQGRGHEYTDILAKGIMAFTKAFYPRPVVYRCTDFKTNEYRNLEGGKQYEEEEENPMIGYRGCSRYIADPKVFALETAALRRVQEQYDNLNIMIPFVRTPDELAQVKQLLADQGVAPGKLWMMVEVPSTAIILDQFLDVGIDGVSIGSNDLTQLILGVDRDNSKYADLFDERNDAVLWCLQRIIETAKRRGVTVSICGQAPSFYPDLTAKLVDWGITSVSVSPDMIVRTRDIIGDLETERGVLPPQE
ncbi:MAG: phosphoenolpyruvate synthase, partial [Chloroflexi bacterium]|nr:phosphoenolpyruvate synthase [Chloroflexota bacterium]